MAKRRKSKPSRKKVQARKPTISRARASASSQRKRVEKLRRELKQAEKKLARVERQRLKQTKERLGILDKIFTSPIKQPKKSASKRERRQFESRVFKAAKSLGLTKAKTAKAPLIDKLFRRYRGTFTGKEIPMKVSKKMQRQMKRAGAKTEKGKVFLKARVQPIKLGAVRKVKLPLQYRSMAQYLEDMKTRKELEKMKPPGAAWAFRVFGHDSYNTYATLAQMADDFLRRYQTVQQSMSRPKKGRDWIKELVFIQVAPRSWAAKQKPRFKRNKAARQRLAKIGRN